MSHLTQSQINSLLSGALSPRERADLLEHTLACDECAALLWQTNAELPEIAPPLGLEARVLERAHKAPRAETLRSYTLRVFAAMAAALILLFSGVFRKLAQLDLPKLNQSIQTQFTEIIDYAKEGLHFEPKSK